MVYGLSKANYSYKNIVKTLEEENVKISKKGIQCIYNGLIQAPAEKFSKMYHPIIIRNEGVIKIVGTLLDCENPPTHTTL